MDSIWNLVKLLSSTTARHTFYTLTGNSANVLAVLIFTKIATSQLSISDYGTLAVCLALFTLFLDVFDLGLSTAVVRLTAANRGNQLGLVNLVASGGLLRILSGTLLFIFALVSARYFAAILLHDEAKSYLIVLAALGAVALLWQNFIASILQGLEQFLKNSLLAVALGSTRLLGLLLLIFYLPSVSLFAAIFVLSPVVPAVIGMFLLPLFPLIGKVDISAIGSIVKFSRWMMLFGIFAAIGSRLDILMLSSTMSTYQAGVYGAAARLITVFILITTSFGTVLVPRFSRITVLELPALIKKTMPGVGVLIILMLISMILAPLVVPLFVTYGQSIPIFQLLVLAYLPFVLSLPAMAALYTLNAPQVMALVAFCQLVIVVFFNWLLIPPLAEIGVIISLGISHLMALVIAWTYIIIKIKG
ncbi:oligosaccharide flippase family protein [Candidatus Daviesbacteria bacterium]|nr:oligosaccharide flippase family protein [Candidatus Daviesbacteria bacterium]